MASYTTKAERSAGWAVGGTIFAATMMVIVGIFQVMMGIAAVVKDQFFVVSSDYVYKFDTTVWGWIHLGIGALAVLAGFFLFTDRMWARVIGIALASLSAIANFFFIPYYPIWSMLVIAVDVFVIWALSRPRGLIAAEEPPAIAPGDETWQFRAPSRAAATERPAPTASAGTIGPRT